MVSKILYWIPRVLTIIALLFMGMFSLDVFSENESFGLKIIGFLAHNIPALILLVVLLIAWKWELAGGLLFILASFAGSLFFHSFSGNPGSLVVLAPFVLAGLLFILHSVLFEKRKSEA